MPVIKLENVTKRWGKFYAVENLDLVIENNAFVTLLGPSGCGKTTTLRMIAGLETPTEGRITIGDTVVFDSQRGINIPANKRKVGFLFQNYALWPNMTVYQNISFGLSNVKEGLPEYDFALKEASRLLAIADEMGVVNAQIIEAKDKSGKLDEKKALLRLIDTFEISIYSAKKILSWKNDEINEIKEKLRSQLEEGKKADYTLDEEFRKVKDGKILKSVRKLTKEEIDLAVRRVSRLVKIGPFMDRYPAELSGGQQQRVAIARTLAPEPAVLFMDEPLSNLDAKLRLEMRYELQRLHVETGSTFVYVTHDQMEAMTLATRICLINNGVLQQYAAPLDVYNKPENLFVADFVGNPSVNFVEASGREEEDGSISLELLGSLKARFKPNNKNLKNWFEKRDREKAEENEKLKKRQSEKGYVEKGNKDERFKYHISKVTESELEEAREIVDGSDFVLGIRPECIDIEEDGKIKGEIYGAMPTGMESTIKVRVGDYLLTGVIFGNLNFKIGSKVNLKISSDRIMLFDRSSGRLITTGELEF